MICAIMICLLSVGINDMPHELAQHYTAGRYQILIDSVDEMIAKPAGLTPEEIAHLHLWKGFALVGAGEKDRARTEFVVALSIIPSLSLDPRQVSPKIIEEFQIAALNPRPELKATPQKMYLLMEDRRSGAALRSLALPGWGQWSLGKRTKGTIFTALALSTTAGWVISGQKADDARNDYLNASPSEISQRYDDYNRWYRTHRAMGYSIIGIWAASVMDILFGPAHGVKVSTAADEVSLSVRAN